MHARSWKLASEAHLHRPFFPQLLSGMAILLGMHSECGVTAIVGGSLWYVVCTLV